MVFIVFSIFAVYSITTILTATDGPHGIFYRLRKRLKLLECFTCTSVYVGVGIALLSASSLSEWFIYSFGLSGMAIMLHKIAGYEW